MRFCLAILCLITSNPHSHFKIPPVLFPSDIYGHDVRLAGRASRVPKTQRKYHDWCLMSACESGTHRLSPSAERARTRRVTENAIFCRCLVCISCLFLPHLQMERQLVLFQCSPYFSAQHFQRLPWEVDSTQQVGCRM